MTVKTEGQYKGEHIVSCFNGGPEEGGDLSFDKVTFASGHGVVKDGTVLKNSGAFVVPATGTVDTAGDSDEDLAGTAYGNYDTTNGNVAGAAVARLAVVNTALITTAGSKTALVAALKKLFIIAR